MLRYRVTEVVDFSQEKEVKLVCPVTESEH